MKELSIEEKAKAYDKAIERAKQFHSKYLFAECNGNLVEYIFPELAESEDEEIRKELIDYHKRKLTVAGYSYAHEKWIAWLEKQGKQKSTLPIVWKYKNDNIPLSKDSLILNKYGCVAKSPSGALVGDVWVIDYDELAKLPKEEFEKQAEQKETPCDKCRKEQPSHSCQDISSLGRCQGEQKPAEQIENFDVKSFDKEYNEFCKKNKIKTDDNSYKIARYFAYWQKPINEYEWSGKIKTRKVKGVLKEMLDEKLKPTWSEEDEKNSLDVKCLIGSYRTGDTEYRLDSWIDSLKNRVQPKQEWSEEDIFKVQIICKYLNEAKKYYADITEVRECMDWLKSLKNRVGCEVNCTTTKEWNEEDENQLKI